jgi:flagellar motor switch protein FliG
MAGSDEYRRQLDILFQQMEEKAKLAQQAKAARVANILNKKSIQRTIALMARLRKISPEEMAKILEMDLREDDGDEE